ncbi:MAG: PA14 domain-containing protein [Rhodothermales bacterium]|nr:PA14 domain-containing protein [Rhodothermales bacterium]
MTFTPSASHFASRLPALFLALVALVAGPRYTLAQGAVYLPQNGLVVVQAESLPLTGQWVIESSEAGHTGSGYLRYDGPNSLNTPGNGTLALSFRVDDPGEYFVKLRMSHLGAPAGDQENDCWLKVNDGDWDKAVHPSGRMNEGFTFHTVMEPSGGVFTSPLFDLAAGVNTVYLSGRSNNFRVDRIHIYKSSGVSDPENLTYPESPKEGAGGGSGSLTVVNGTGDGTYPPGTTITVRADAAPADQVFDRWTGATTHLANALAATTTLTMPAFDVSITATYKNEGTVGDLREPENPAGAVQGIAFEYYEQTWDFLGDFDALTPVATGVTDDIDLDESIIADGYLLRFTGYLNAPNDGQYTLYTASDDGSQMYIGDRLVVDNDSIQSIQERSGTIGLKAGLHAITVGYFERTGDAALSTSWAGPGFSKTEIPATAFFYAGGGGGPALGDVSLNGTISALDASQILIHAVGQILLEPASLAVGDVSGNGDVSAFDAALILQFVAGLRTCFPVEAGCTDG